MAWVAHPGSAREKKVALGNCLPHMIKKVLTKLPALSSTRGLGTGVIYSHHHAAHFSSRRILERLDGWF
jgi:hypothetical protein